MQKNVLSKKYPLRFLQILFDFGSSGAASSILSVIFCNLQVPVHVSIFIFRGLILIGRDASLKMC